MKRQQTAALVGIMLAILAWPGDLPAAWQDLPWPAWAASRQGPGSVEPVAPAEARLWLRWVIPLPKQVRLEGKLTLPASGVAVQLGRKATDVEQNARDELLGLIRSKTGASPGTEEFRILAGVCDGEGRIDGEPIPGADRLAGLKNTDQAYVIAPLPQRGLAVAALSAPGVYHGLKTLSQLIEPRLEPGKVTLPVAAILDWPDLAERGQWGGSANRDVQYLADRKMNLIESHTQIGFDERGRGVVTIDAKTQNAARLHAINWVPIITHLDHLSGTGIFDRYPELKGKGPQAQHRTHAEVIAACFSEPKTAEILAQWFESLAATPAVEDINVWLSEIEGIECRCAQCGKGNQYALETAAAVRAWQLARKSCPNVRLRVLLTQGSYPSNDKVLAAAPAPVGITYYSGSTTYDSSRDPMIYPLLEQFAAEGRWLGVYPQLTASWRIVCPWSGPQFIKYRMTEFVDKRLASLCGYATPDNRYYDFNVTAAAEWSWNARGRDEREFAAAWATRRGLSDPEKAAEWAVSLGPVGWNVYGSRVPFSQFFGQAARLIQGRHAPAWVGEKGMFRHFPSVAEMDRDLATCQKALDLAGDLADPALIAETHVIRGYVRMIKSICLIANGIAGKKELDPGAKSAVQAAFDELSVAGEEVAANLEVWRQAVAPDDRSPRFADTVDVTRQTVQDIGAALKPLIE